MKKMMMLVAFVAAVSGANAQSNWYILPEFGIGTSGIKQGSMWPDEYISNVPGYSAKVKVGYQYKNWRLETGLQYLVEGYKQGLIFSSAFPDLKPNGSIVYKFPQLAVPLQLDYQVRLSDKFNFVPSLGVSAGWCLYQSYVTTIPNEPEHSGKIKGDDFESYYNRINLTANTSMHIEYKCSNRFSLVAGPSFQYMVTDILKNSFSFIPESNSVQHNYLLAFDIGLKINL